MSEQLETIYFTSPAGAPCNCPNLDSFTGRHTTCKRRFCPRCGYRWAQNWGAVTRLNLEEYGGAVAMITITAPGADVLPWDCNRDHKHAGSRGCRVKQDAGDVWSANASENWKKLRDAARRACARAGLEPPRILERAWEPQKRGVPHVHIVVGMATAEERAAAQRYVDELARLAPDYLFGYVDRGKGQPDGSRRLEQISAQEASQYLTSYLLGRRGKKASIRENIADPRMPRSLLWMSPVLTRATKVTMRRLRYARWFLAALNGNCTVYPKLEGDDAYDTARAAVALQRTRSLYSARPPDESPSARDHRERMTLLGYVRTMRVMRLNGWGTFAPPARAAA